MFRPAPPLEVLPPLEDPVLEEGAPPPELLLLAVMVGAA
jgi:hypothetical protein